MPALQPQSALHVENVVVHIVFTQSKHPATVAVPPSEASDGLYDSRLESGMQAAAAVSCAVEASRSASVASEASEAASAVPLAGELLEEQPVTNAAQAETLRAYYLNSVDAPYQQITSQLNDFRKKRDDLDRAVHGLIGLGQTNRCRSFCFSVEWANPSPLRVWRTTLPNRHAVLLQPTDVRFTS